MRLKILLVNPWIYDFAAFNLWARPLGLLRVAEYLSAFDVELCMIDCTDCPGLFTTSRFGTGKYPAEPVEKPGVLHGIPRTYKRYGISTDEFVRSVRDAMPFDAVLMTSMMSYWYPGVQRAVELIRSVAGDVPVVLGGIYATLYQEHAASTSGADFIFKGPLSESLNFALTTFGFKLKRKREALPYQQLNFYTDYPFAPVQTSTGCPFRCSYCASEIVSGPKYRQRLPEEVMRSIEEFYKRGVRDYAFYDDALLYEAEKHFKPLLREVITRGIQARFHTPNGLHARFVDEEIAALMRQARFKTVRLSLETVNPERQYTSGGKVSNNDLGRAVQLLKRHGFTKDELGVYLMYGLPGQSLAEVIEGIAFLKTLGVRIFLAEYSPVRGTSAWEELVQNSVIDDSLDPLLTNNTVFSLRYSGYDAEAVQSLKLEVKEYNQML